MSNNNINIKNKNLYRKSRGLSKRRKSYSESFVEAVLTESNARILQDLKSSPVDEVLTKSHFGSLNWCEQHEIIEGTAISLWLTIKNSDPNAILDEMFSEHLHPLGGNMSLEKEPEIKEIISTISRVFLKGFSSPECCIMSLVFIDRIIAKTGFRVQPKNWRRILLVTLIVACKVWEDESVWVVDYLDVFPNLNSEDLIAMEKELLTILDYNLEVKPSLYAKYYFEVNSRWEHAKLLFDEDSQAARDDLSENGNENNNDCKARAAE